MIIASVLFYAACMLLWFFVLLGLVAVAVGAFCFCAAFREELKRDDTDWQDSP